MPIYEYDCHGCQQAEDRLLPISRCAEPQPCDDCGEVMEKRFSLFNTDRLTFGKNFYDHGLGRTFANFREKDAYLKKNKLIPLSDSDRDKAGPRGPKTFTIDDAKKALYDLRNGD